MLSTIAIILLLTNPAAFPPVYKGCNPPADICETMLEDCLEVGVDPERCELIAEAICPGSPCMAHDAAERDCSASGLDCTELRAHANAGLAGCSCELKCTDSDDLPVDDLIALCLTYPSATGDDCAEPSAGQCMALLTLSEQFCDVNACEYVACQRDIMAQGDVCEPPPASCAKMIECDKNENGGGAAGPRFPGPDDWKPAPAMPENCLRLAEVFVKPTGQIAHRQWVRIRNVCTQEVDVFHNGTLLRWTQPGLGWGGKESFGMSLAGIGIIGPGDCVVVGGPESNAANYHPLFDLPIAFLPPLDDGASEIAGVGLFRTFTDNTTPFDSVAYGRGKVGFLDHHGKPATPAVSTMGIGHSLLLTGKAWAEDATPTPNVCGGDLVLGGVVDWSSGCGPVEAIADDAAFCTAHPWGRPASCGGGGPTIEQCQKMLEVFDGCGVTICEFSACAEALAHAPCGATPAACVGISTCST